jgi:type III restriction enzyme
VKQVVIENPILNSPFEEPRRHFKFSEEGITDQVVESRRISSYFVPIAQPRKKSRQLSFDTEWTKDRIEENKFINEVRARVLLWRDRGRGGVTKTTARLLSYWTDPDRENKLFFCQIEALETAIYLTEVASKLNDGWIENRIREGNEEANPGLYRIAFKMATGSGKTVVMAMLIAWQTLNKLANPQDGRFSDAFLVVTPGITIRDRLRVLLPNDPGNYYRQRDLLPSDMMEELGKAKILVTNFHTFLRREKINAGRLTKSLLSRENGEAFQETPDQMVRRVCRELGNKKNIIVINDEAHHCYRHKPDGQEVKLTGDERRAAEKREEAARVWLNGLLAVKDKVGIKAIYDLSATPFFLRGSGYGEGTLFPWVVSDFSLIDAIESGIVKVPRVPVADDSMTGEAPTYRDIWLRIRDHLPKKGRGTEAVGGEPKLPVELQGALHSLYGNYEKYYRKWEQDAEGRDRGRTPPVFIVVCNNTNVSKMVFDYIAGWEKPQNDGGVVIVPGALPIFSNERAGAWSDRPNTILIDSEQLESGEAMSADFKKIAAREIDEFKREYRVRFPGRDPESLTDEDLLREVMNTIGKPGKLGEEVKCVVSVSMLTEGWDANTVTHILGVRAFGTQLLCEQVVGRGLRRTSYGPGTRSIKVNRNTVRFEGYGPEYAEVYGVPFSFIPCSGSTVDPRPPPEVTRVRALEDRVACEITFPRVAGYRYELPAEKLTAKFGPDSHLALTTKQVPTKTENAPIVGETSVHTLDDLKCRREQEVAFLLAKLTVEKYFRQDCKEVKTRGRKHQFVAEVQFWRFPEVLEITRRWMEECLTCKDNAFPQLLLLIEYAHDAADRIYASIVRGTEGEKRLLPLLEPYNTLGSTRLVDFDTARPTFATDPRFCHISHVVCDTESWEQKMAQTLEELGQAGKLFSYAKNHNLHFFIPYTINGEERKYIPDFIARMDDGRGKDDPLNLIIEVTGEKDREKEAKVSTARNFWLPAVNNHGEFGRWAYAEITDPWDAKAALLKTAFAGKSLASVQSEAT